ncbi:MAG: M48 family metalloprotease [Ilumatobacteraceae bacterium]|nr:M48 family metalloprotease [Ilumatobacteraceae bacterium]
MSLGRLAPLGIAVVVGVLASGAHRRIRPAASATLLAAVMGITLVAAVPSALVAAAGFVAHPPAFGGSMAWCHEMFGVHPYIDPWLGAAATLWSTIAVWRVIRVVRSTRRLRRDDVGEMEVVDDEVPYAFTMPGAGGRVLVSTGLISALDPTQFAVVVAHERAHARHRHDRYALLGDLAAAIVPPLAPVRRRLRFELERWADEAAVRETDGDRRIVAETLAHVALLADERAAFPLGFNGLGVAARVEALLRPPDLDHHAAWRATFSSATVIVAVAAAVQLHHSLGLLHIVCPG